MSFVDGRKRVWWRRRQSRITSFMRALICYNVCATNQRRVRNQPETSVQPPGAFYAANQRRVRNHPALYTQPIRDECATNQSCQGNQPKMREQSTRKRISMPFAQPEPLLLLSINIPCILLPTSTIVTTIKFYLCICCFIQFWSYDNLI